jgi:hypothetical protein
MISAMLTAQIVVALGLAQSAALPPDERLAPVRARLDELVARTVDAGLPADLVVSKVREGLAKGVPADRIQAVVERLAENLQAARSFVVQRRAGGAAAANLTAADVTVVRALAEARLAGVALANAEPVVGLGRPAPETARAIEVLTDLSLRGYPTDRASAIVREVFARDGAALGRLPASLEVLRREQGLTHAETLDALSQGLRGGGSLEQASGRAADSSQKAGRGPGTRGGGQGAPPGREGFVPPGQLKKQTGARNARPESPGRGPKPR